MNRLALTELQHKLSEAKIMCEDLTHTKTSLQEKLKQMESIRVRLVEEHEAQVIKVKANADKEI